MRRLQRDDEALGQVVAFLVAGVIFLGTVAGVIVATRTAATDPQSGNSESVKSVEASGLADLLVGSPGVGWAAGADGIQRLGLAASNGSGLSTDALDALRGAMEDSSDNGKVDYQEALESLGLATDGSDGMHIRIYPLDVEEASLAGKRVAYIGDWTSLATAKVALPVGSQESMAVKANVALNLSMFAASANERRALDAAGAQFNDRVYVTTAAVTILVDYPTPLPDLPLLTVLNVPLLEGDVYPDSKTYLDIVLANRLPLYDVLVIGSGVDHSALSKNEVKNAIAGWVLSGGTLIALGSDDKSTSWINPLLNAGVDTVNGAPMAPDISHPLLKSPNELAWPSYDSHDQGWDIQESGAVAAYDDFSHIIVQDDEDVLAVSKTGSYGSGQIILSTYRPRDIAASLGQAEAGNFFENLLSYVDQSDLYLDYGGSVPDDRAVALEVRQSWIWDPTYGQVPVRVEVLAWG
jgi:hypothetical protein